MHYRVRVVTREYRPMTYSSSIRTVWDTLPEHIFITPHMTYL
jgi:hypothetical protein